MVSLTSRSVKESLECLAERLSQAKTPQAKEGLYYFIGSSKKINQVLVRSLSLWKNIEVLC